jgi:hypothetical protein
MCFGSAPSQSTQSNSATTSAYTPSPYLTSAAQSNLGYAQNLQSTGFTPYTGQQVAQFAPQQQQSFGMGSSVANAVSPNVQLAGQGLTNYLNSATNEPTVSPETISSQMSPYMNQYVNLALQPQLQAQQAQQAQNQQLMQGQATSAGAFGDPRANMLQLQQQQNNTLANQSLVGNAYNSAFNTAIGAGAQDVSNNLQGQVANAGLYNTGLANQLSGVNAAYNQGTGATNLLNTLGGQQTAQSQAGLNAAYNQYLMAQQYPFQTTQLMNQTIGASVPASPSTGVTQSTGNSTTSAPNNSGLGMLGSLFGSGLNSFGSSLGSMLGGSAMSAGTAGDVAGSFGLDASDIGAGSTMADALPALLALAKGGPIKKNQPALVGEKGPELFVPHQAGTVVPYHKLKAAMKNKKSVSTDRLSSLLGAAA